MSTIPKSKTEKLPKTALRRGLGRGLSALIPESDLDFLSGIARGQIAPSPVPLMDFSSTLPDSNGASPTVPDQTPAQSGVQSLGAVRYLDVSAIEANPWQPRQIFSEAELEELVASVREHGVLQPVLVRPVPFNQTQPEKAGIFQLIAGERRWRAAQRAGLTQIPVIVREVDDRSALELAIIENVQRHDISSVESAQAYRRLAREFGLTQDKIAARVGKSRASIANTMRLLELTPDALAALRDGHLSEGHGRALLTARDEAAQRALLRRTLRESLSVRDVERLAREGSAVSGSTVAPSLARARPDVERLETLLGRTFGVKFQVRPRGRGGALVISYSSPEELQRLVQKMTSAASKPGEGEKDV